MSMAPSPRSSEPARIIIVMGVSSSGKSTIGAALGRALHAPFLDGDKYHPEANVEKMRAGTPLTDATSAARSHEAVAISRSIRGSPA